ncbi:MAG: putative SctF chaperone SctG [Chlamydiota bacterium]|jgi:predicted Zn-dependent protease
MASWKQYKEDTILFIEAGFIAVNQADEDSAKKLFEAAQLLDPSNHLWKMGVGYLHLHKLELKEACKMFQEVLDEEPSSDMAKAMLGVAMGMMPQKTPQAEKILEQTLKSKDPLIKKLSDTAIHFIDTCIKKTPGPAGRGRA